MQTVGARFEILGKNKVDAMSTMDKHMESPQQSHSIYLNAWMCPSILELLKIYIIINFKLFHPLLIMTIHVNFLHLSIDKVSALYDYL